MNWRTKSLIQKMFSALPDSVAERIYYKVQRRFGVLKVGYMRHHFLRVTEILEYLSAMDRSITDRVLLEVGTGRSINIPIGLWLCGAGRIHTVDLNRYLKESFVVECVDFLEQHRDEMTTLLGPWFKTEASRERLQKLLSCRRDLKSIMELTQIEYYAPADAASLPISSHSIDFHYSVSVLEHVPPDVIERILREAKRLLVLSGLSVHIIDPSDHFSHADSSISAINFLRYSEAQWNNLAGNKYSYHNRLRVYDLQKLFETVRLRLVHEKRFLDQRALDVLRNGFRVDPRFEGHDLRDLATCRFDIVGSFEPGTT